MSSRPSASPIADRFWIVRRRLRLRWLGIVAPHKLAPETLYGMDGEPPHFVRADLARTQYEAAAYLAADAEMTVERYGQGMLPVSEIERVWMVETPMCPGLESEEGCEDDDCDLSHEDGGEMHVVPEKARGAVAYWRWGW